MVDVTASSLASGCPVAIFIPVVDQHMKCNVCVCTSVNCSGLFDAAMLVQFFIGHTTTSVREVSCLATMKGHDLTPIHVQAVLTVILGA